MGEPPSLTQLMGRRSLHPAPLHPDPADPPSRRSNVGGESGRMRGGRGKNFAIQTRNRSSGKLRLQRGAPPPPGGCKSPGSETYNQKGRDPFLSKPKGGVDRKGTHPGKVSNPESKCKPPGGARESTEQACKQATPLL